MTEKRFVDYFDKDHNYIIQDLQNEDEYQVGFVNCDEDVFLKLVNEFADENELLKQQIGNLEHTRDFCAERCERLEKENEELKFEIRKVQRAYEQLWEHTYK